MKRCGVCGLEYDGEASKDGADYRLVRDEEIEYGYECWYCHNVDTRCYPRKRPGAKQESETGGITA